MTTSVNLYEQLIGLETCLKYNLQKIHSIKELPKLSLIKLNCFASSISEVLTAYCLFFNLPVTIVTDERSFSKLKAIKSYLTTSMEQERL